MLLEKLPRLRLLMEEELIELFPKIVEGACSRELLEEPAAPVVPEGLLLDMLDVLRALKELLLIEDGEDVESGVSGETVEGVGITGPEMETGGCEDGVTVRTLWVPLALPAASSSKLLPEGKEIGPKAA